MALIYADLKLCDIILNEPTLIPVINRFGIALGIGDKSVRTICEEKGLDCHFFLTMLNTFINEEYFPENRLKTFCIAQIVDFLNKANLYYERFQLPNIERHFNSLIEKSDVDNNNLELVRKFFIEFKKELLIRIENDKLHYFPSIKEIYIRLNEQKPEEHEMDLVHQEEEQDPIEAKLNDLKSLFVKHLTGEYDVNLCYAVIFALYSLEKDIHQHNRIRHRILEPMVNAVKQLK